MAAEVSVIGAKRQSPSTVVSDTSTAAWHPRGTEGRFRAIVETAGCPIVVLSSDHCIVELNAEAERIHGCQRHRAVGKNFLDLFLPEHARPGVADDLRQVLAATTPICTFENRISTGSDGERVVLWKATRLRTDNDTRIELLVVGQDTSDRKRAERALRESEERLHRSQELEAMGTQTTGIAHDLNNIMSLILGHCQRAMQDVSKGSVSHGNLAQAVRATERAKSLVKQIFLIASGSPQDRRVIELHEIVDEALLLVEPSIPPGIKVRKRLRLTADIIQADPTQMHQVVINLCTNAVHAMSSGQGLLDVALDTIEVGPKVAASHRDLKPGSYVRLTITDTGHGIRADLVRRIFDPFFTTKRCGEGIGMGLAAVLHIVRAHGGAVTVESHPSRGTSFAVYLPRADTTVALQAAATEPGASGRERILADRGGTPLERARNQLAIARVLLRTEGAKSATAIANALGQAQTLVREAGVDLYEPFLRIEFAELARVTGDHAGRERELREARRLFNAMGATLHANRITRELQS
jgi:PAS domain S-box-containing protein